MKLKLNELDACLASYEKLGKIKGLIVWQDILFNKIKSKRIITTTVSEFEEQRKELLLELCEKDENQKPLVNNNEYVFTDENKQYVEKALIELANQLNAKEFEVDLTLINIKEFDKIKNDCELADILEPLVLSNLLIIEGND